MSIPVVPPTESKPSPQVEKKVLQDDHSSEGHGHGHERADTIKDLVVVDSGTGKESKKSRRRGSISISRIGQLTTTADIHPPVHRSPTPTRGQTPTPIPTCLTLVSKSPFYQAQLANGSTTSVASGASAFSNEHAYAEEDHTTQMEHIAGKETIISKILPRRLSRARSTSVVLSKPLEQNMVIGVCIEQDTVETTLEEGECVTSVSVSIPSSRRGSVAAARSLKHKASMLSMSVVSNAESERSTPKASWLARARNNITTTFRRKSKISVA